MDEVGEKSCRMNLIVITPLAARHKTRTTLEYLYLYELCYRDEAIFCPTV